MNARKNYVFAVFAATLFAGALNAQDTTGHEGMHEAHMMGHSYEIDPNHSQIGFKIRHMAVATVRGKFHDVKASIVLDPSDVSTLATEAVISVASIDTENENRDNDLRSEGFFDVAQFPELTFASTQITDVGEDGSFKLHGLLTIRDVTKEVVLDAEMTGPIVHRGTERIGFAAETTIDRFEYGLKWNALTEAGGLVAGRDVDIIIEIEARRKLE